MENPIKVDDLRVPLFQETPIWATWYLVLWSQTVRESTPDPEWFEAGRGSARSSKPQPTNQSLQQSRKTSNWSRLARDNEDYIYIYILNLYIYIQPTTSVLGLNFRGYPIKNLGKLVVLPAIGQSSAVLIDEETGNLQVNKAPSPNGGTAGDIHNWW